MIDGRENLLTDDERQRWLRGIQAAEAEELACLEPAADMPRDRRIADAVVRRMAAPPPTAMLTRRALLAAAVVTAGIGIWQAPRWLVAPQPKLLATYQTRAAWQRGRHGPRRAAGCQRRSDISFDFTHRPPAQRKCRRRDRVPSLPHAVGRGAHPHRGRAPLARPPGDYRGQSW